MLSLAGYSWLLSVAFTKSLGGLSSVLYGWLVRSWIYSRGQAWVGRPRWRLWLTRELLTSGKINRWKPSQRPPSQHQNQVHPKTIKPQCPDAPCQSFNKTETQHCTLKPYQMNRHPKTHYWTRDCPSKGQDPVPSIRTQAQVPPNKKPVKGTGPTSPLG